MTDKLWLPENGFLYYWLNDGSDTGAWPMDPAEIDGTKLAFALWGDLLPFSFIQTTNQPDAKITVTLTSSNAGNSHVYLDTSPVGPGVEKINHADIYYNEGTASMSSWAPGSGGFHTALQGVGLALGLDAAAQDNSQFTVMSSSGVYDMSLNNGTGGWTTNPSSGPKLLPQTPMLHDIEAIQSLYGTATLLHPHLGHTTYGFNSSFRAYDSNTSTWFPSEPEGRVYDFYFNPHPLLTIFDRDGPNTLDVSGSNADQIINFTPGTFSSVMGMHDNVALAFETTLTTAIGGGGNDRFIMPKNDFFLDHGVVVPNGPFVVTGGLGTDTIDYSSKTDGITVTLNDGVNGMALASGQFDTLQSIERVVGGAGDDMFKVDSPDGRSFDGGGKASPASQGNTLSYDLASAGIHVVTSYVWGAGEIDNLSGTASDTFMHIQNITGTSHNDTFTGGPGSYNLDGGGGSDTLDYSYDTLRLTVDLQKGQAWKAGTDANQIDTIDHFETFIGGSGGDTFRSRASGSQDYYFYGSNGTDTLDYAWDTGNITVDLTNRTVNKGQSGLLYNGTDHFSSIEKFIGGKGDDKFLANADSATFWGGAGTDTLDLRGTGSGPLTIDLQAGKVNHGGSGWTSTWADYFSDMENFIGGGGNDILYNAPGYISHSFDGGNGNDDTVVFHGARSDYTWSPPYTGSDNLTHTTVTAAPKFSKVLTYDAAIDLVHVEHMQFSDGTVNVPTGLLWHPV